MSVIQNRALRFILSSVGALSLILGFIGAFLAAWCFVKCSPKAHQWIYRQRLMGPALKNWEENRAISRRSKVTAISMIAISAIVIGFQVQILWLKYCFFYTRNCFYFYRH